jgi:Cof subfamily protein (haloacid dehalogenase superfamily)
VRLLAIDLDGTLLRRDKTISPADREAVQRAHRSGVKVALVTGRLRSSTLAFARELGLEGLMSCGDGGLLLSTATGEVVARNAMAEADARHAALAAESHSLGSFVLLDDAIHYDKNAAPHAEFATAWTSNLHPHERLLDSGHLGGEVLGMIQLGLEPQVSAALAAITSRGEGLSRLVFPLREQGHQALKLTPTGVDKATGLSMIAQSLGIDRRDVVAVGDWLNDIPMLRWAGRSFAMGNTLEPVRAAATYVLEAPAHGGGGVAELVARELG